MPTDEETKEFAERFNRLLRDSKESLSDEALAEVLSIQSGVSFTGQAIWNWKNGKNRPRASNLRALAQYLRVSPAYLQFGLEERKTNVKDAHGVYATLSNIDKRAIDKFALLNAQQRKLVRELIAQLSE